MALQFPEGRHPNRKETIDLLKACHKNRENVEAWNAYLAEHRDWRPDVSDHDNRAHLMTLTLAYEDEEGAALGINLSGAKLSGADLRRANLNVAQLYSADLSEADLEGVDLSGATLTSANLSGANLYGANVSGAVLQHADLSGANLLDAILSGAYLANANLSGADLEGANLSDARLWNADLRGADLRDANLSDAAVSGVVYDLRKMRGKCQGIRVATCFGHAVFKRDAEDQDYIDTLMETPWDQWRKAEGAKPGPHDPPRSFGIFIRDTRFAIHAHLRWFHYHLWEWIDYGRSMWRVAVGALVLAVVFGFIFSVWPGMLYYSPNLGEAKDGWITPFYYSIVTYTTLGFGDVTPCTWIGQIVVVVEVICGYVTLGLLVSILANKVARRS